MKTRGRISCATSINKLHCFHKPMLPVSQYMLVCMAPLLFSLTVANAQFTVQPMAISQTMAPGESNKTLLSLENRGQDYIRVQTQTVDLAKNKESQWVLIEDDAQDVADLVMVASCRHWLTLPKGEAGVIDIEPEGTTPLDLEIQVPAIAKGSYQAAVKLTLASTTDSGVRVRYAFVVPVMLEISIPKQANPTQVSPTDQSLKPSPPAKDQPEDVQIETAQKQPGIISGRCTNANGQPASEAQVLLFEQDYDTDSLALLAESRTDAEGRFSMELPTQLNEEGDPYKTYMLFVPANGHGPAWKRVKPNATGLELVAHDSTVVTGHVHSEGSKPVAGAHVWVQQIIAPETAKDLKSRPNALYCIAPLPGWSCLTDKNGSFRIAGVPNRARISLIISHPDFARGLVYVKPGRDGDIKLLPAAVIEGRVVHEKTGMPAVGVRVQAQGVVGVRIPGGFTTPWATAVTNEQGRYQLTSLHANKYNIWAKAEGLTVVALESFEVETGQTREAPELRLVKGGFITGRVVNERTRQSIRPGQFSAVAIYGPSRPKSGAAVESSQIREDGSFRIRVAPGRNYIYLGTQEGWHKGQAIVTPPHHWVTIKNGQTVEVEFKIRKLSEDERGKTVPHRIPTLSLDEPRIRKL